MFKRGGIFWEGGVDYGTVEYNCEKEGRFWDGGVDSVRVAYRPSKRKGGRFWEGGIF